MKYVNFKYRIEARGKYAVVGIGELDAAVLDLLTGRDRDTQLTFDPVRPEDIRIMVIDSPQEPFVDWRPL